MISLRTKIEDMGYNVDLVEESIRKTFKSALAGLAHSAHAEWIRLAQSRLNTSRDLYVNGLRQAESFKKRSLLGQDVYDITLVGRMPNAVEFGMPSFDMKNVRPGWLGGSKAKTSKSGHRYVVIPFRHSKTSTTTHGYSGRAKRENLQRHLKKTVRDYGLNRMVRTALGKVRRGPVTRVPKKAPVHPYLRGLTRIQHERAGKTKTGKQRGSAYLLTWRTMSEASHPDKWVHPGIEAKNLLQEVESWVHNEMENIVKNVLGEL